MLYQVLKILEKKNIFQETPFITSFKAVLLHNGNKYASVPAGYSIHLKETYETMSLLLEKICYHEYKWCICGDLKVITIVMGMQTGYTKYCCFICEWDSRDRKQHWIKKSWPIRNRMQPGNKNVLRVPLIDRDKVFMPPLHIKLGLMKNFVKALDNGSDAFRYLCNKFPELSNAKVKEGVFIGPQIRKVIADTHFQDLSALTHEDTSVRHRCRTLSVLAQDTAWQL